MSEVVSDVIWVYYFQKFPAFVGSITVYDHLDYLTCLCYALLFRRKWSLSIQTLSFIFLSVYSHRLSFSLKHMLEITKVIYVLQARKFEELKTVETRSYYVCSLVLSVFLFSISFPLFVREGVCVFACSIRLSVAKWHPSHKSVKKKKRADSWKVFIDYLWLIKVSGVNF